MANPAPRPLLTLLEGPQTFQVFKDHDTAHGYAHQLHGTLEEHHDTLQRLNENGMGVFFTVNQTDGKGRKAENIVKVRAYICDIDDAPTPKEKLDKVLTLIKAELPPSAIVESKNGLHCYWYAAAGENVDAREYALTNQHLIKRFGGCVQSKDIARVLRVPGYHHRKDPNDPFLVKRIIENPERLYTQEQIRSAYPLPDEPRRTYVLDARHKIGLDEEERLTEDEKAFRWRRTVEGLAAWTPVEGQKHRVLLLAFGVARKLEVPRSQAETDLYPIVAKWPTKDTTEQAIEKHAAWAYSEQAEEAHINGLRSCGVTIDLRGGPNSRRWKKRRRPTKGEDRPKGDDNP